jgi:mannose-6-phosphate isomerase-like protein (cupin superfamily)
MGEGDAIVASPATVLGPAEGRSIFGRRVTFKVDAAQTGGAYSVHEAAVPPFAVGARPHVHDHAEESMYILAGRLLVELGGETVEAPAGTFLLIPRGMVHAYRNATAEEARFLGILSPAASTAARARRGRSA